MATWIDWPNKIINVPRADMLLVQSVPTEIRELQIDTFRRELGSLLDEAEGMPSVDTHKHNTIVTLGGVTYARLIEIINGYTVTFEDGQYAVNLVGANSNIGDVVNVNQVSVRSANSAGLTYSKEIEDLSYSDARLWINTNPGEGVESTQYPAATPGTPVSDYDWAEGIATIRGLPHRFHLVGTQELTSHLGENGDDWEGKSSLSSTLIFNGVNTSQYNMSGLKLQGTLEGNISARQCVIDNLNNFDGEFHDCGLLGTNTIPAGVQSNTLTFHNGYSMVPGQDSPVLDCNNATNINIHFRAYVGGLTITNYSSPDNNMTIDLTSGHVIIDATCTNGTIVIRGSGHITNNSTSPNLLIVRKGLNLNETDGILQEKRWIALH